MPRETAHTGYGASWLRSCRSRSDHYSSRHGSKIRRSSLCLEMSTMLLASRGQVELFGEQPTRGPTVSFRSLILLLHPPSRRESFSLIPSQFVSIPFYFSLFVSLSFACLVHSYAAVAHELGNVGTRATRKDHLVLYILAPAAMILSTAFKNIRRLC